MITGGRCSFHTYVRRSAPDIFMKTTIVIPNYNGLRFLPDCMQALSAQRCQDFDVVVVDNGSQDGSYDWLRRWQAADPARRHGIYLSKNLGFPAAVNKGIRWAMQNGSRYVILLNNDTKAAPDFVAELNAAMDKDHKERFFAFSSRMIKMHDNAIMDDAGDQYTVLGWAFQRGLDEPVSAWNKPARVFSACAGAAIYRLSALKVTGLFDEAHFAYLEDLDLSYRAQLYGYRIGYLPSAVCQHVGSGTSGSKYNDFKVRLSARNSIYVLAKNMPLFQLILNAPAIAAGILIKQLFFYKKGFGWSYFLGLCDALRSVKQLKRANLNEVPPKRYLIIELALISGTLEYLAKAVRKYRKRVRG